MRIDSIIQRTAVEPRPYQGLVVGDTTSMFMGKWRNGADQLEQSIRSVLVESPTGSGKTVMGMLIALVMQQEFPELAVGWVAMRKNLLAQALKEVKEHQIPLRDLHVVSMFNKHPDGLIAARAQGRPIMMVMDEAQHDAAESAAHLHNILEPNFILGLTATPFRTDKMKLCFEKVVKRAGIHQLISDGYLSEYNSFTLPKWDAETVVEHYAAEPERWGKSIFYFLTKEECREAMVLMQARETEILARLKERRPDLEASRLVEFVDGALHPDDREDQLDRFRNGETVCLVNCMILTEGFDDPTLETSWVRDSSKGPTMQMAGRVFRKHPAWKRNGDERFRFKNVVQSKATHWPMIKTAMAKQQFVWSDEQWLSLTVNPHLALINHNARVAIAQTVVEMPKFIVDKMMKKRRMNRIRMA